MGDDLIDFEDGAAELPKQAIPWGLITWTWASVLIVPPVGIVVSAAMLIVFWRRRRFITGLWVPAAGLFTSLALTVTLSLYVIHGMEIEARQRTEYLECRENVQNMAKALAAFIAENGRPPERLEEIAPALPGRKLPVCPAHSGSGTGYEYRPERFRAGEGYRIILFDSEPRHLTHSHLHGRRIICRQDGRVVSFAEETFEVLISRPADRVREALGESRAE